MSIWDNVKRIKEKSAEKAKSNKPEKLQKELSDEIQAIRKKNKEFQATNETDTYLVICFSCKDDKDEFLHNLQLSKKEHTYLDGYEVAEKFDLEPKRPKFKLKKPLNK
jgi:hypothetical protein